MRLSLLFLLFFYLNCFSQTKVQVSLIDCRNNEEVAYSDIILYKDSQLVAKIPWSSFDTHFLHLDSGNYAIEYTSIIGTKEKHHFQLGDKEKRKIIICIDEYEIDAKKTMIDCLARGNSYTIDFTSQGCFHTKTHKIEISRNNDGYFLQMDSIRLRLTKRRIDSIRKFEIELLNGTFDGNCTDIHFYTINAFGFQIRKLDDTCKWNGMSNLFDALNIAYE